MKTITLNPAFTFDCEECGRENFVRCTVSEMSEEDQAELRADMDIADDEDGEFCLMPEAVTCSHCGAEFRTEHWG